MNNVMIRAMVHPIARAVGTSLSTYLLTVGVSDVNAEKIATGVVAAIVVVAQIFIGKKGRK